MGEDNRQVKFFVPMEPVAKARARHVSTGKYVRSYTPKKTVDAQNTIAMFARAAYHGEPHEGPIFVEAVFIRPMLKSFSSVKKNLASHLIIRPTTKPDIDNYEKLLYDALSGIMWKDDSQVVDARLSKVYGDRCGIAVRVTFLNDENIADTWLYDLLNDLIL